MQVLLLIVVSIPTSSVEAYWAFPPPDGNMVVKGDLSNGTQQVVLEESDLFPIDLDGFLDMEVHDGKVYVVTGISGRILQMNTNGTEPTFLNATGHSALIKHEWIFGISYIAVLDDGTNNMLETFAPVVARLAGK